MQVIKDKVDREIKNASAISLVCTVKGLETYKPSIPRFAKQRYMDIAVVVGGTKGIQEMWKTLKQQGGIGNLPYLGQQPKICKMTFQLDGYGLFTEEYIETVMTTLLVDICL